MTSPSPLPKDQVRIATVQHLFRKSDGIEDFRRRCAYFVDAATDRGCDFILFPELMTLEVLSARPETDTTESDLIDLNTISEQLDMFWEGLAVNKHINIIAGSTLRHDEHGRLVNSCGIFLRDGRRDTQLKIHPTPNEVSTWDVKGGDRADITETDCGPIGVMICYDSEFPELARHLVDQGALILFVPFCTDDRRGYLRVRHCSAARAIENQAYVVLSGVCGNLPDVNNMDIHYAESCILTPSDIPFARDGIAAEAPANIETMLIADLSLSDLLTARQSGAVQNLKDRRFDLYSVNWRKGG